MSDAEFACYRGYRLTIKKPEWGRSLWIVNITKPRERGELWTTSVTGETKEEAFAKAQSCSDRQESQSC